MNSVYLERSLIYQRQEKLVQEVRANRFAKRLRTYGPQDSSGRRYSRIPTLESMRLLLSHLPSFR